MTKQSWESSFFRSFFVLMRDRGRGWGGGGWRVKKRSVMVSNTVSHGRWIKSCWLETQMNRQLRAFFHPQYEAAEAQRDVLLYFSYVAIDIHESIPSSVCVWVTLLCGLCFFVFVCTSVLSHSSLTFHLLISSAGKYDVYFKKKGTTLQWLFYWWFIIYQLFVKPLQII